MKKIYLIIFLFLVALSGYSQTSGPVIFLVRHCEKAMESTDDPNLSKEGKGRARHLAEILSQTGIEKIYSTPTKRTLQTAEPLAKMIRLTPTLYNPKEEALVELLKKSTGKSLVVGHSNTLPQLLNALSGSTLYQPSEAYGELWVVTLTGDGKAIVYKLNF
jgi:broad specificity phosphatase PhoE